MVRTDMPTYMHPRPIATVDVVLLTSRERRVAARPGESTRTEQEIVVALVERTSEPELGRLALPGTYVHVEDDRDLYSAARRVLEIKCGLTDVFVEQLRTYGTADRDARDWSVTTAYYALVPPHVLAEVGEGVTLVPVDGLSGLPFDHDGIVQDALARVRSKATYSTLPALLLPETFTFRQLEEAYEGVMGRHVHTAGFRRKLAELTCELANGEVVSYLVDTGNKLRIPSIRPSTLYKRSVKSLVYFPLRF